MTDEKFIKHRGKNNHEQQIYDLKNKINMLKQKKEQKEELDELKKQLLELQRQTAEPLPGEKTVKKIAGFLYNSNSLRAIVKFVDKITDPPEKHKKRGKK